MKRRLLAAGLGIATAGALGASSAFMLYTPQVAADIPQSSISRSQTIQSDTSESESSSAGLTYTIKDYEGQVAIFIGSSTVPDLVFEAYTRHLPEYDQKKLKEGIMVEGYDRLMELIEDYIS